MPFLVSFHSQLDFNIHHISLVAIIFFAVPANLLCFRISDDGLLHLPEPQLRHAGSPEHFQALAHPEWVTEHILPQEQGQSLLESQNRTRGKHAQLLDEPRHALGFVVCFDPEGVDAQSFQRRRQPYLAQSRGRIDFVQAEVLDRTNAGQVLERSQVGTVDVSFGTSRRIDRLGPKRRECRKRTEEVPVQDRVALPHGRSDAAAAPRSGLRL
ncbi:hypothetical protein DFJ74DRAFT_26455 [Hyaloraphidium curvatum]|nr:hypothetical protein DFJ74DRAFT_26455 [Hyaloraphidium curvatum]